MSDLYLTPAEKYTAALGGFYYGDLPEPGTVYTQLIKDILDGSTPDKVPKNILARFIYSLYISDLGDPYPRYELAKLLYWKLHNITPTKSGSILTVTIYGKEDYITINTDLSRLWYKVLFGSKTDVITEFPYIFNTMQNKLSDWELFGNTVQSGTPTPDSPVTPQGTGERTGNVMPAGEQKTVETNGVTFSSDGKGRYHISGTASAYTSARFNLLSAFATPISVSNGGQGTLSFFNTSSDNNVTFVFYNGVTKVDDWKQTPIRRTTTIYNAIGNKYVDNVVITVNSGATVDITITPEFTNDGILPSEFEPYGYKIPISSAGQTTPVYLGEVQTTRKIKKYEFTGQEAISQGSENYYTSLPAPGVPYSNMYCTQNVYGACRVNNNGGYIWFKISSWSDYATAEDLKAFFQQEYAAGTPVTVWYVLAEPETAVVNEPLMKIGDYADSMSRDQTGIDIPTVIGLNTLDVLTTVKPSSMSIEYTSADENRSRSRRISLLKSPLKKGLIK